MRWTFPIAAPVLKRSGNGAFRGWMGWMVKRFVTDDGVDKVQWSAPLHAPYTIVTMVIGLRFICFPTALKGRAMASKAPRCLGNSPVSQSIQDGTLCRNVSPRPGPIGKDGPTPGIEDHLRPAMGGGDGEMGEEAWFEDRYPNLLNNRKSWFLKVITEWTFANWGKPSFDESEFGMRLRQNIYSRGSIRNDNEFEKDGDKPQTAFEADKVLGSFAIDITTPVAIKYSAIVKAGRTAEKFRFATVMYVEDVLGLQEHDTKIYDRFTGWLFPSRKVRRASWTISGEGMSYIVKAGDTLSLIAKSIYDDATKWKLIQDENRIQDPNKIRIGERLRLP